MTTDYYADPEHIGRRVRISQDVRMNGNATGAYGAYMGMQTLAVIVRLPGQPFREFDSKTFEEWNATQDPPIPEMKEKGQEPPFWFPYKNPLIRLDDGTFIWGVQCWWVFIDEKDPPLEEIQKMQRETEAMLHFVSKYARGPE